MRCSPVKEFVLDTLLKKKACERGLFKPAAIEKFVGGEAAFGRNLYGVLCLKLWHEQFVD